MKRICVVTGSRAEFGLLTPIIHQLKREKSFETDIVVTGAHLNYEHNTEAEIQKAGIVSYVKLKIMTECSNETDMAIATGRAIEIYAKYLAQTKYDIVLLLGDRYEIFSFATAAAILNMPIAHLCGGDTTEGAVDEFFRHSITKMSNIHLCSNEQSRRRVVQLGENPDYVYNVGSTAVEIINEIETTDIEEIKNQLGLEMLIGDYAIVTYHPVTTEIGDVRYQVYELVKAMEAVNDLKYLITMANVDAGGDIINEIWQEEVRNHDGWALVGTLGIKRYLSFLKQSKMMIGNSSSGLSEAPILGIPTVNIGNRQKGRYKPKSVIDCNNEHSDIVRAIMRARDNDFKKEFISEKLPYGSGDTSKIVAAIIREYLVNEHKRTKAFYDIIDGRG